MPTKNMILRFVPAIALFVCLSGVASAQELSWAEKMFDEHKHDFGTVARGAEARYRFKFTNNYEETVHISHVKTTCGCTGATPSKDTIPSGESAYIEVAMDTNKFSHEKNSNAIIVFDKPFYKEVRLPIRAYIRTDVVVTPGWANFGSVDHGETKVMDLSIQYSGRADWHVTDIISNNKYIVAEATETSRSAYNIRYNLKVTVKEDAPLGVLRDQVILVTDDSNNPKVPVLVEASIESDLMVANAPLALGNLFPGQVKNSSLIIKGKVPFEIESIECESRGDMFKVKRPETAKKVQIVPIMITPSEEDGNFSEEFTIKITGREEPLKFTAYGRIVAKQ
ncbi:hypothetical protein Pla110_39330 [Polystyrenella longa]|uniref:DUF1573 domain-containing protein n=1 Tax=Polystyrenella longa TaxID=2528007 RepID=A0A518CSI7_9PLAN|nr:DUF1573 domain-containing protein [Polystyrenella longa]QDU82178.1 hypothetical protein Pla110_39330 [Polystyrenella longa]